VSIMVVSYEYTWYVGIFQWPPSVWDTVIPFALGFAEVGPAFFLDSPVYWWVATAIFCIFGALGFCNTLSRCDSSTFGSPRARALTLEELIGNAAICLFWASLVLVSWRVRGPVEALSVDDRLLLLPYLGMGVVMLVRGEKYKSDLARSLEAGYRGDRLRRRTRYLLVGRRRAPMGMRSR
jgi:hypothetical protein